MRIGRKNRSIHASMHLATCSVAWLTCMVIAWFFVTALLSNWILKVSFVSYLIDQIIHKASCGMKDSTSTWSACGISIWHSKSSHLGLTPSIKKQVGSADNKCMDGSQDLEHSLLHGHRSSLLQIHQVNIFLSRDFLTDLTKILNWKPKNGKVSRTFWLVSTTTSNYMLIGIFRRKRVSFYRVRHSVGMEELWLSVYHQVLTTILELLSSPIKKPILTCICGWLFQLALFQESQTYLARLMTLTTTET